MPVRPEEVLRMARLAQLQLRDEELSSLTRDLGAILELVAQISDPDGTDGREPAVEAPAGAVSPRRPDEAVTAERGPLLSDAPELAEGLFRTPGAF